MRARNFEDLQIVAVALEDAPWVLWLGGELDIATVGQVRGRLREFDDEPVALDLGGLTFTDSTGLAFLLEERVRAQRRGTPLRIRGAGGQTLDLLERTGLLGLLSSSDGSPRGRCPDRGGRRSRGSSGA
jgi:anti-anti-sigma factor